MLPSTPIIGFSESQQSDNGSIVEPSRDDKQLSDDDETQMDPPFLSDLGESRVRKSSCFTAEIKLSVWLGGFEDLNRLKKFMCRLSASSALISLFDLTISSLIASAQSPQIQRPWYLSRTRSMYSIVHSSVNPQQSHFANSTSRCLALEVDCISISIPDTAFASTVAAIAQNLAPNQQKQCRCIYNGFKYTNIFVFKFWFRILRFPRMTPKDQNLQKLQLSGKKISVLRYLSLSHSPSSDFSVWRSKSLNIIYISEFLLRIDCFKRKLEA